MNSPISSVNVDDAFRDWRCRFIAASEQHDMAKWMRADLVVEAHERWGRQATAHIVEALAATPWAVSASYIRMLYRTALAFPPSERTRWPLPFSYFRVAAVTDRPTDWIQRAFDHRWFVRDLIQAIHRETYQAMSASEAVIRVDVPSSSVVGRDYYRRQKAARLLADAWGSERCLIRDWDAFRAGWDAQVAMLINSELGGE
ncbi:hypothetical protein TPY_2728 [Sulfobacillus acidophilus TPY]|uniref:Uncharacterized protein n=1 Tax=Sulfobacillus acidophilus (strain ATCC 700253 / DSM 10332 / NAL) TaxID=679936 RepID=G8TUK6_SULAD|nr:hypothetical protein TPY_2728 [Sulfobacillus acidophilus TPY]AEW04653.1 hypothetical protein Sulac_1153 [Sulfobacillus acidophilus DSM 10332]